MESKKGKEHYGEWRWYRLKALLKKEYYQIIRDPSSFLIAFVLPLILLFLYGYGVSLDINNIKLGVVMEDRTPEAFSFVESLTASPYFNTKITRERHEMVENVVESQIRGFVVIPSYFSSFRLNPDKPAPLQLVVDGSETNTANILENYVLGAWQLWQAQENRSAIQPQMPLATAAPRVWYNEELKSRNFLVPGSIAIIMTLIGTLLTALVISREWERGTMESLISTPVTIMEILLGKLIPYFIMGMGTMTLCVIIDITLFGVPLRGSYWVLFITTAVFLFSALGTGLLISSVSRNQFISSQISLVTAFLPAFILSGFIFEISSMPMPIQLISSIIPARYFVSCLQTIFLVGNVWQLILPNILAMLLFGSIVFGIVAFRTVKRLD